MLSCSHANIMEKSFLQVGRVRDAASAVGNTWKQWQHLGKNLQQKQIGHSQEYSKRAWSHFTTMHKINSAKSTIYQQHQSSSEEDKWAQPLQENRITIKTNANNKRRQTGQQRNPADHQPTDAKIYTTKHIRGNVTAAKTWWTQPSKLLSVCVCVCVRGSSQHLPWWRAGPLCASGGHMQWW